MLRTVNSADTSGDLFLLLALALHIQYFFKCSKKISEYYQEIPHSHTADQTKALRGKAALTLSYQTSGRQLKQQALSLSRSLIKCKTRKDRKYCIAKQRIITVSPQTKGATISNKSTTSKPPPSKKQSVSLLLAPKLRPILKCCKTHKQCLACNAMHHHRETI